MINIVYDKEECKITVSGHAGYAEKGSDIVCAAISALYQTLLLREHCYEQIGVEDDLRTAFTDTPMWNRVVFDTIAKGMEAIARQYPENVAFRMAQG